MNAREWPTYVAKVWLGDLGGNPQVTVFHAENDQHARDDGITLTKGLADAYSDGDLKQVHVMIFDYAIGFFDGAIFTGGSDRLIFDSHTNDVAALLEARNHG